MAWGASGWGSFRKSKPGVCFGESSSVTVKQTRKTDGLFASSCFCSSSGTGVILTFSAEELYVAHTVGGRHTTWTPCAELHRNATVAHHLSLMSSTFSFPSRTDGFSFRLKKN